jgi:hypothetical protein
MFDDDNEDELLLEAVTALGAKGGAVGTGLVGAGTRTGAEGGARGAARGMKRTKKDVSVTSLQLPGNKEIAFELVRDVLAAAGRLVGTEAHGDRLTARALLSVGIGGLNPVVVTASVTGYSDSASQLELRAAGREGLIKQHPADKAITKVTQLLEAWR